jgi:hypothetical protein
VDLLKRLIKKTKALIIQPYGIEEGSLTKEEKPWDSSYGCSFFQSEINRIHG